MQAEMIQSDARFSFRYLGNNQVDAEILSETIKEFAALVKITAINMDPSSLLRVDVTAFKDRSFKIDFIAFASVAATMLVNPAIVEYAKSILDTVRSYFAVKKHLEGELPHSTSENSNGTISIKNRNGVVRDFKMEAADVINNYAIDNSVVNITLAGKNNDASSGFKISTENESLQVDRHEYDYLATPIAPPEEKPARIIEEKKVMVAIIAPVLYGFARWGLRRHDRTFQARMEDEIWLERVARREVDFRYGDKICIDMEILLETDDRDLPILGTEKYTVKKVYGNVIRDDSEQTNFET